MFGWLKSLWQKWAAKRQLRRMANAIADGKLSLEQVDQILYDQGWSVEIYSDGSRRWAKDDAVLTVSLTEME